MQASYIHVRSMRIAAGDEVLVARVVTGQGKVGFGFSFRLDATEARHMAEWNTGLRKDLPSFARLRRLPTASGSSPPPPPASSGATR